MLNLFGNGFYFHYLCGCEWLYDPYCGHFGGFVVDYEAVAMVPFLPLGRAA